MKASKVPPSARNVGYGTPRLRASAVSSTAPSCRMTIHSKVAMTSLYQTAARNKALRKT